MKKYKERCVKTDLYFILNYLYTHGDGESEYLQDLSLQMFASCDRYALFVSYMGKVVHFDSFFYKSNLCTCLRVAIVMNCSSVIWGRLSILKVCFINRVFAQVCELR